VRYGSVGINTATPQFAGYIMEASGLVFKETPNPEFRISRSQKPFFVAFVSFCSIQFSDFGFQTSNLPQLTPGLNLRGVHLLSFADD